MSEENSPGVKYDQGKPRFPLIQPKAEMSFAKELNDSHVKVRRVA